MTFTHLHVHSQYSILDASLSIAAIVKRAQNFGMKAIAITDHGNLFGTVDFYKTAKEAGLKPIIGCEINIAPTSRFEKKKLGTMPVAFHTTLIAKNATGYKNLCALSSKGYLDGFYYVPRVDFDLLKEHSEGLICLSGCMKGPLAYEILNGTEETLKSRFDYFHNLFGDDFYLEVQRHGSSMDDIQTDGMSEESWLLKQYQDYIINQEKVEERLKKLSKETKVKLCATHNCHYLERNDWRAHEVMLNIQSGEPCRKWHKDAISGESYSTPNPKRDTFPTHELYLKSSEEMQELFKDLSEAITTTQEIVEKCTLEIDFKSKHYPVYYPPGFDISSPKEAQVVAAADYLKQLCESQIPIRYTKEHLVHVANKYPDKDPSEIVKSRLAYELSIISSKGMCDYLLIVWDFINWAKRKGIPMGPGRGSGAGAIICYLIGITDIEPLRFNLLFERFINPERLSYPDIDVDICMDRRPEVIQYTIDTYGKDNVAQIITFGTMKAKMSVKDVGRALDIPLAKVNQIAKLIPDDLAITIEKALQVDPDLQKMYATDSDTKLILDLAKTLEGCVRNTGIHAAGLIVSGEPLMSNIPITNAKDSEMLVTQFSMKPVESVGMLKIDFLGLKTLTCIQKAVDAIKARHNVLLNWINLSLDDGPTFELLNQGKTLGIFQLESGGMQDLSKQLHLDRFEEIIAVLSLYRPGPMDMIPSFIARKHGREKIEYDHPWMKEILQETYGIMVYQEQVMQIASKLANYSLGEGDVLRRAMGKKDSKEMAKQRDKFVKGAESNSISTDVATSIFDKMEKFAEYGFNKSHAAAYGYLTYVTAYLKANYPSEWLAALMTCDKDDTEKVAKFLHEGQALHIPTLPPDINESLLEFAATDKGIRFALSGIKGIGLAVVETIVDERKKRGPYKSLYDFVSRCDLKRIGKKTVETLIDAGAFDFIGWHRDEMRAILDSIFQEVSKNQKDTQSGFMSLFAAHDSPEKHFSTPPKLPRLRSREELLFREKELLGLFLTGNPLSSFEETLKKIGAITLEKAREAEEGSVFRLAFIAEEVSVKISNKTQKKFAILRASDTSDAILEIPIWPELFETQSSILIENALLWGVFSKEKRNDETTISCRWLGELKHITPAIMSESDLAYDKAKSMSGRRQFQKPSTPKAAPSPPKAKDKTILAFDLQKLRSSHMVLLKSILSSHVGLDPVEIHLSSDGVVKGVIQLPQSRFVKNSAALKEQLQQISSFLN